MSTTPTSWSNDDHLNWWWDEEFGQEMDNVDIDGEESSLLARKLKSGPFRPMSMPNSSSIQIEGQINGQPPMHVTTTTNVHDKSKPTFNIMGMEEEEEEEEDIMGSRYRSSTNKNKSKKTKSSALAAASKSDTKSCHQNNNKSMVNVSLLNMHASLNTTTPVSSAKSRSKGPTRRRRQANYNYGGSVGTLEELTRARKQNLEASITSVINEGQAKNTKDINASATSDTKNYRQDDYLSPSEITRAREQNIEASITSVINEGQAKNTKDINASATSDTKNYRQDDYLSPSEITRAREQNIEASITSVINEGQAKNTKDINASATSDTKNYRQDDYLSPSEITRAREQNIEASITSVINEGLVQRSIYLNGCKDIVDTLLPTTTASTILKNNDSSKNTNNNKSSSRSYRSSTNKSKNIKSSAKSKSKGPSRRRQADSVENNYGVCVSPSALPRAKVKKLEPTRLHNEGLAQRSIQIHLKDSEDIVANLSTPTSKSMIGQPPQRQQRQDDESESARAIIVEKREANQATRDLNEGRVQRSINLNDYEDIVGNLLPTVRLHKLRIIRKYPSNLNMNSEACISTNRRSHRFRSVVAKKLPIKHQIVKRTSRTRTTGSNSNTTATPFSCISTSSNIINEPKVLQDKVDNKKFTFDGKRETGGPDQKTHVDAPLPSWREISIPSKRSLRHSLRRSLAASDSESDEELVDEETIAKRHRKCEIEEKRSIRLDYQYRLQKQYTDRLKKSYAEREARSQLKLRQKRTSRKIRPS